MSYDNKQYWQTRYLEGKGSGAGSRGALAIYKAGIINSFIAKAGIVSAVELGCGDGAQASLLDVPRYHGFDVSPEAIRLCKERFGNKPTATRAQWTFGLMDPLSPTVPNPCASLALSIDVIYHLVNDGVFDCYMHALFAVAGDFAIIYSSNGPRPETAHHVRHRNFTQWIEKQAPAWKLMDHLPNPYHAQSSAEFFIYGRE